MEHLRRVRPFLWLTLGILPLLFFTDGAWAYTVDVVRVTDGDTLEVSGLRRNVRILGIDAPELAQSSGLASRDAIEARIQGKAVRLNTLGRDTYGRWLAQVFLQDGTDVGLEQVRDGWAWVYSSGLRALPKKQRKAYREAESLARKEKRGLWKESPAPTTPWKFRASVKK
jgi:endonuclease YncB( thermonuclease family)